MSGTQYPVESVEFRLCREHCNRKLAYEIQANELILSRLGSILFHTALPRLEQNNVQSILKSIRESEDRLASIMDPVRFEKVRKEVEEVNKDTDENKTAYLEALSSGKPFKGVNDIVNAIVNLNDRIKSAHANT